MSDILTPYEHIALQHALTIIKYQGENARIEYGYGYESLAKFVARELNYFCLEDKKRGVYFLMKIISHDNPFIVVYDPRSKIGRLLQNRVNFMGQPQAGE
jgi:hypothetical protein